jgi:predicted N-acetyltransferase YhbS
VETEDAYSAYLGVFSWLSEKGVRQWLHALPQDAFRERQRRGELFLYSCDDEIAAVVTLARECSPYWQEKLGEKVHWWIKSLAVVRKWRGAGVGKRVMQECEALARQAGAAQVFLDCVETGFLPAYYARLGYDELGRKEITYPSGNTFLVALMKKETPDPSPQGGAEHT